jgi:NitT/TauT family transport system substrate-binding protein
MGETTRSQAHMQLVALMNKIKLATALVLLLLVVLYALRHRTQPTRAGNHIVPIRVGTNRALGTVAPYLARDKGFFQQQSVNAQIIDFNDITTLMESITSGQLDVALVGISSPAIWQERGVRLKVVAAANGGGHVLLTRNDTGLHSLADLRGRKVATPKPGTVTDTLFRAHILGDIAGLDPERDLTLVPNMAAADMPSVLFGSHEVDAAITWEPFASEAEAQSKDAVVLLDVAEAWRKDHPNLTSLYPVNVVIASQAFIDSHPEELRRFLEAYTQAVRFINQQPDEADTLIAQETKLNKATVVAARKRIDFKAHVNVDASLQTLDWSVKLKYLKKRPDPQDLFDLRFLPRGDD